MLATTRLAPASRASGAISASGAAAPNQTVSMSWRSMSLRIRLATDGSGSISVPGCRTTVVTRAAACLSKSSAPFHFGAYTVSACDPARDQLVDQFLQV